MKKIPNKNYYVVLIVSIIVIVLTLYIRSFYLSYIDSIKNSSVFFDKSVSQINIDDLKYAVNETSESFLYIGYTGDLRIYNLEKKIYSVFEDNNLLDELMYLNINDYKYKDYIEKLKVAFPNIEIGSAPMIVFIKDGEAIDIIDSDTSLIDVDSLNNMLTKYGII